MRISSIPLTLAVTPVSAVVARAAERPPVLTFALGMPFDLSRDRPLCAPVHAHIRAAS